jgi:hypothetical protein
VLAGASASDVLVASGAGFLNDGDLVKVVPLEKSASIRPVEPASVAKAASK